MEELFGHGLAQLLPLCGATEALRLQLPSGLGIWVRATLGLRDGIDFRHAVAWPRHRATRARAGTRRPSPRSRRPPRRPPPRWPRPSSA